MLDTIQPFAGPINPDGGKGGVIQTHPITLLFTQFCESPLWVVHRRLLRSVLHTSLQKQTEISLRSYVGSEVK